MADLDAPLSIESLRSVVSDLDSVLERVELARPGGGDGDTCVLTRVTYALRDGAIRRLIVKSVREPPKRFEDDARRTQLKLQSYAVEVSVFNGLVSGLEYTPTCLYASVCDSKSVIYMEDAIDACPVHDCVIGGWWKEAVRLMVRFHDSVRVAASTTVWRCGSYWSLEKRQHELERCEDAWATTLTTDPFWIDYLKASPHPDTVLSLAKILKANALAISQKCHPGSSGLGDLISAGTSAQRLIHGDFKAENIFFAARNKKRNRKRQRITPRGGKLCDFQFVGFGIVELDLVHLIASSLETSTAHDSSELIESIIACADADPTAFDYACLDFCRYVVGTNFVYDVDRWLIDRCVSIIRRGDAI